MLEMRQFSLWFERCQSCVMEVAVRRTSNRQFQFPCIAKVDSWRSTKSNTEKCLKWGNSHHDLSGVRAVAWRYEWEEHLTANFSLHSQQRWFCREVRNLTPKNAWNAAFLIMIWVAVELRHGGSRILYIEGKDVRRLCRTRYFFRNCFCWQSLSMHLPCEICVIYCET